MLRRPSSASTNRRPTTRARRLLTLLAASGLAVAGLSTPGREARAWGRLEHRAAGTLTESLLTPEARVAVKGLLEPNETLADASTWADEVRRDIPESGPWHYVNVPITEAKYDGKFCGEKGCVIGKIEDFRKVLADPTKPRADRQKALRFVVHFVQDMHQPLHVGDRSDRGGNDTQVQFYEKGSNLHRIWDSQILEHALKDEAAILKELGAQAASAEAKSWAGGTVVDWANESLEAAKGAYLVPGTKIGLKKGAKLGDNYEAVNLPVAKKRLAQSAVRLASILNELFAEKP